MTYRARTLLRAAIGLGLMAGLGLFAYYGLHRPRVEADLREKLGRLAVDLDPARVARVVLERPDERTVLERSGQDEHEMASWRMFEPVETDGDGVSVNALLGVIGRMDAERRLSLLEAGPLEQYGLEPPRAAWRLGLEGGEEVELLVGRPSPFDGRLYLMRRGAPEILLVAGHLESSLLKTAFDLREKRLLSFDPARVSELRIEGRPAEPGAAAAPLRIELERRADRWWMRTPLDDRADAEAVGRLLQSLRNLRAEAFPRTAIPDHACGLEPADRRVELRLGPDARPLTVVLGRGRLRSNLDRAFARVLEPPGPLAQVPLHHLTGLQQAPDRLRFRAPLDFDPDRVARLKLTGADGLIVLERGPAPAGGRPGEAGWSLVAPVAAGAKGYKVRSMLATLAALRASRFEGPATPAGLARTGLTEPSRSISLSDAAGQELGRLQIGAGGPGGTFVLGDARAEILLVPTAELAPLRAGAGELRDEMP